jgi:hypothetical protein
MKKTPIAARKLLMREGLFPELLSLMPLLIK